MEGWNFPSVSVEDAFMNNEQCENKNKRHMNNADLQNTDRTLANTER